MHNCPQVLWMTTKKSMSYYYSLNCDLFLPRFVESRSKHTQEALKEYVVIVNKLLHGFNFYSGGVKSFMSLMHKTKLLVSVLLEVEWGRWIRKWVDRRAGTGKCGGEGRGWQCERQLFFPILPLPFLWWILPSRAYVSALGFLDGLKEQGVLDCTTYFSSLSGSSWLVAPLSDSFWVLFFSSLSLSYSSLFPLSPPLISSLFSLSWYHLN